jgi:primosomal protein N'
MIDRIESPKSSGCLPCQTTTINNERGTKKIFEFFSSFFSQRLVFALDQPCADPPNANRNSINTIANGLA